MTIIRALPTRFDGITFRSRLEADWAATLKSWGMAYVYEPEGYKLQTGVCYSPDFYLPDSQVWLEVKGAHNERIGYVHDFDSELSGAWHDNFREGSAFLFYIQRPLVVVGREPRWVEVECAPSGGEWWPDFEGARYHVELLDCARCRASSFCLPFVGGGAGCRVCGVPWESGDCEWNVHEFTRLPRPMGRQ